MTSQIICCPENTDNEINLNGQRNSFSTETHRTLPSLDTLLHDTGLNTNYRDYTTTTTSRSTTRYSNQNNYYDMNRNRDYYTVAAVTNTRKLTTTTSRPAISNYQPSGSDRNGRRSSTSNSADDLIEEAYSGQPTVRPDRPKRRDGPRISMQSK